MFEKLREGFGRFVEKIATSELTSESIRPILEDFKINLIQNDVAVSVADHIGMEIEDVVSGIKVRRFEDKGRIIKDEMRRIILNMLNTGGKLELSSLIKDKNAEGEPFILVFLGINGTGKTTTIAKLARLLNKKGYSVVMACSDTYRAGAIEQIEEHGRRIGVRVISHRYGSDPAAVAYDSIRYAEARGIDVVLIDTAGRMQTDKNLMDELKKIVRVTDPDFRVLVVDSLTGNDAVNQAEEFNSRVGIDGSVLTKVDADVKGGTALSVIYVTKKPILYIGVGQRYEDLMKFNPERFVDMILS